MLAKYFLGALIGPVFPYLPKAVSFYFFCEAPCRALRDFKSDWDWEVWTILIVLRGFQMLPYTSYESFLRNQKLE